MNINIWKEENGYKVFYNGKVYSRKTKEALIELITTLVE